MTNRISLTAETHPNLPPAARADAGAANNEVTGMMSLEALAQQEATLVDVPAGKDVVDACGDDRLPTKESIRFIAQLVGPDTLSMREGYASIFGARVGKAAAFFIAGIANARTPQEKRAFVQRVGGFPGVMAMIQETRGRKSTIHSDIGKEGSSLHFDTSGDKADKEVGCLYNGGLGLVLGMLARHRDAQQNKRDHRARQHVTQVMRDQVDKIFGADENQETQRLLDATAIFLHSLEGGLDHAFGREDYRREQRTKGAPIVILEGEHPSVINSGLGINYDPDRVGSPFLARSMGISRYRNDPGRIALGIGDMLVEHDIPTELFLRAATMLAMAVRAALVAADSNPYLHGKALPEYLPIGVTGPQPSEAAKIIDDRIGRRPGKNRTLVA